MFKIVKIGDIRHDIRQHPWRTIQFTIPSRTKSFYPCLREKRFCQRICVALPHLCHRESRFDRQDEWPPAWRCQTLGGKVGHGVWRSELSKHEIRESAVQRQPRLGRDLQIVQCPCGLRDEGGSGSRLDCAVKIPRPQDYVHGPSVYDEKISVVDD